MFDGLRKLFSSKEKPAEEKKMNFDEIKKYFYENSEKREKELVSQINAIKNDIDFLVSGVAQDLKVLKTREIVEKRAKPSELVKNKFCEKSLNIINDIEKKNISSIYDSMLYNDYMKKSIGKIDLSPKEVMHVKFFFSEDFSQIAKKINEILRKLDIINNILTSEFVVKKTYIEKSLLDIDSYEKNIINGNAVLEKLSTEFGELESKKRSISFIDTSELRGLRSEIKHIDTRLSYLRQQVNSEFSGASRILKRIYHKDTNVMIENYISSPYEAFMQDGDNKIRLVLLKALVMVKDGKADADKKTLDKIEILIEKLDELSQYREEIKKLDADMSSMKEKEQKISENESANKKFEKEIKEIEHASLNCKKAEESARDKIKLGHEGIADRKKKIAEAVCLIFGKKSM